MKSILTILISFGLAFSVFGQTRNVMVGTNGAIVQPTNFWSADASNARAGLGLGDSATNPASAFQSSSSVLSNLASSNAINLTNVRATNIIGTVSLATNVSGIVAIANGGTAATTAGAARTNLGLGATWLTNTNSTNFLSAIGISSMQALNIQSLLVGTYNFPSITNQPRTTYSSESIEIGTNSGNFQIDVTKSSSKRFYVDSDNDNQQGYVYISGIEGIGFEGTNSTNAILLTRTNLGLGSAATNSASAFQPSSSVLSNLANNNGASLTNITVSNLGTIPVVYGGTGATNVEAARTNLGLGSTNTVQFDSLSAKKWTIPIYSSGGVLVGSNTIAATSSVIEFIHFGTLGLSVAEEEAIFNGYITNGKGITVGTDASSGLGQFYGISFASNNTGGAAITRTNLGLGSSWLTSTNNPVFVNTNGEVVSPTNFWQVAPIQTLVQSIIPVTNSTNAATNARNLYIYSLATNVVGVTNTITLPTNSLTFNGDAVTITHDGTTSSVTAIRQLGSATNFTTISNFAESVKFIRESDQWGFYHNISYVEPIRFTDGAIEENKAVSRTNLGLGFSALTNTNAAGFQRAIFYTNTAPSNIGGNLGSIAAWIEIVASNGVTYKVPAYTNIP